MLYAYLHPLLQSEDAIHESICYVTLVPVLNDKLNTNSGNLQKQSTVYSLHQTFLYAE
jgi:hypothetical protein